MNQKTCWIWILVFGFFSHVNGQENVSVLHSGDRLMISTEGQFGLGSDILEEDAVLLATAKARYQSTQHAMMYLMKNPTILPLLKNEHDGAALSLGLITIEEEEPGKTYFNGQQYVRIKFVMALALKSMHQRLIQIQKQAWLLKTYQIESERTENLYQKLIQLEAQGAQVGFQEMQSIAKQSKASEWMLKGLQSNNAATQAQQFDQAVNLDPNYIFARYQRGKAYYRMKAYEKALEDYHWCIQQIPDWIEAYHARGLTYGQLENYSQVIEDNNRVLNEDPECMSALINRGIAYSKTDQLDAALADYQKVLTITPNYMVVNYNMGCIYALQGNVPAALKSIESAFNNGFSDFDALLNDEDLKSLQDSPEFQALIEKHQKTMLE